MLRRCALHFQTSICIKLHRTTPSGFCLLRSTQFSFTLPSFPSVSYMHTHTHTAYNLWRLKEAGMHTHDNNILPGNRSITPPHSTQGLALSALQLLPLNWLTNPDFASLLTTRERYMAYPYPHTHTHTLKILSPLHRNILPSQDPLCDSINS